MILKNDRHTQLLGMAAAMLAVVLVFHFYGVTVWRGASGQSLFGWLYMMWSSESTDAVDYSHGMVIPLVSLWLLWRRRADLLKAFETPQPHVFGAVLLAVAIGLHFAGLRMQIPHASALGFVIALWGLAWTFGDVQAAKLTLFPMAFL